MVMVFSYILLVNTVLAFSRKTCGDNVFCSVGWKAFSMVKVNLQLYVKGF